MTLDRSMLRWKYALGVAARLAVMVPLLVLGFGLLFLLDMGNQIRLGGPVLDFELSLLHLAVMGMVVFLPITIALAMGESVALLAYGLTRSVTLVILIVPLSMALLGWLLATSVFVDPQTYDHLSDRLFSCGGLLLFFLAGSLQVWAWQEWTGHRLPETPIAWYGAALVITAGFLGSMIAWQAPSPYVREVDDYYRQRWEGKSDPVLSSPGEGNDLPL